MTDKRHYEKAASIILLALICAVIYCIFIFAFRDNALNAKKCYDFVAHTQIAKDIAKGLRSTVYPLLYGIVNFVARRYDYNTAMAIVTSFSNVVSIAIIFIIFLKMKMDYKMAALLSPTLIFIGAIFNLQENRIYIGTFSPNPIHNPTYIFMKPFALATMLIIIIIISRGPQIVSGYKNLKDNISWVLLAAILVVTTLAKPSFPQVFLPGAFIFIAIYIFKNKLPLKGKIVVLIKCVIVVLPVILLFIKQYYDMIVNHIGYMKDSGISFGLGGFKVWKASLGGGSILFAIFCMCAFPLAVTLLNLPKAIKDDKFILFWAIFLCSIMECLTISESGINKFSFNMFWGYDIASLMLIIYSTVFFVKTLEQPPESKKNGEVIWNLKLLIPTGLYALHLATGVYYVINIFTNTTYKV